MQELINRIKEIVLLRPIVGKRTQLLVLVAFVLNAYAYMSGPNEFSFSRVDARLLFEQALIATIGTMGAKLDRMRAK